MDKGSNKDK